MLEDTKEILYKLGLKESEIQVYLECFKDKHGLFISQITKRAQLKRSTINLIVERLVKQGFLTFHIEGSRKRFTAESLESILFHFEEIVSDFKAIIPLIKAEHDDRNKTKIKFFEGKETVERIFNDILLTMKSNKFKGQEILAISSGEDVFRALPNHGKQFINKRIKEGIHIKWLAPKNETTQKFLHTSKQDLRELRFFDGAKYPFNTEINLYGNKIAFISFNHNPMGVIIENKTLHQSCVSVFNMLWDIAEKNQ